MKYVASAILAIFVVLGITLAGMAEINTALAQTATQDNRDPIFDVQQPYLEVWSKPFTFESQESDYVSCYDYPDRDTGIGDGSDITLTSDSTFVTAESSYPTGTFTINYTCTDDNGNSATFTQTIKSISGVPSNSVRNDTAPPRVLAPYEYKVIAIQDIPYVPLDCGDQTDSYSNIFTEDNFASTFDSSDLDISTVGEYEVEFTCSDEGLSDISSHIGTNINTSTFLQLVSVVANVDDFPPVGTAVFGFDGTIIVDEIEVVGIEVDLKVDDDEDTYPTQLLVSHCVDQPDPETGLHNNSSTDRYDATFSPAIDGSIPGIYQVEWYCEDDAENRSPVFASHTVRVLNSDVPILTLVSIESDNANDTTLAISGNTVTLSFTSSEAIEIPDVTINTATATVVPAVAGSNTSWSATKTITSADSDGAVAFTIDFSDLADTPNDGTTVTSITTGSSVTVDQTAPTLALVSITSDNSNPSLATTDDTVTLSFTSSEPILPPTVTINGVAVSTVIGGDNTSWSAETTITDADADGIPVTFTIDYSDLATNEGASVTSVTDGTGVTVDQPAPDTTAPTLTAVSIVSSNTNTSLATTGNIITLSFTSSVGIETPTVTINGGTTVIVPGNDNTDWSATRTITTADTDDTVAFEISFTDLTNNVGDPVSDTTDSSAVTVDQTAPTLDTVKIISDNSDDTSQAIPGDIIRLSFTSSEPIQEPVVTINGDTIAATVLGSDDDFWFVERTITSADTDGTVEFEISFTDLASNGGTPVIGTTDDTSVIVDTTAPTLPPTNQELDQDDLGVTNTGGIKFRIVGLAANTYYEYSTSKCDVKEVAGTSVPDLDNCSDSTSRGYSDGDGQYRIKIDGPFTNQQYVSASAKIPNSDDIIYYTDFIVQVQDGDTISYFDSYVSNVTPEPPTTNPTLSAVSIASSNTNTSLATINDIITLSFTSSEPIRIPIVTINTATATAAPAVAGSTTSWSATKTITSGDADGPVAFSISYSNLATNDGTPVTSTIGGSSVTIDQTAPTLALVSITSDNSNPSLATTDDTVTLSFTSSEPILPPTVTINGVAVSTVIGGDNTSWSAETTITDADADGIPVTFVIDYSDLATNEGASVTGVTDGTGVTVDQPAPDTTSQELNQDDLSVINVDVTRDAASDFILYTGSISSTGITATHDGKRWVVDASDTKVYVYDADGTRDADSDFDLDSENDDPTGITTLDDKFWVVDASGIKVYVYNADGTSDSDFDLDEDNDNALGITVHDGKLWVANAANAPYNKVYAYNAADGTRAADSDFILDKYNTTPNGITSLNNQFWVANAADNVIYVYNADGTSDIDSEFHSNLANNTDPHGITATPNGKLLVVDNTDGRVYVFNAEAGELESHFNLHPVGSTGITAYDDKLWIADFIDNIVYAYNAADGTRDAASDFDLDSDNKLPFGITSLGGKLWVGDASDGQVYAYNAADGTRDAASDFDLDSKNDDPTGITAYDGKIWVVDATVTKVYAYNAVDGTYVSASDFELHSDNGGPYAITALNDKLWVADVDNDKVYVYNAADGTRDAASDFILDAANGDPEGITALNGKLWVADIANDIVYAYDTKGIEFSIDGLDVSASYEYYTSKCDVKEVAGTNVPDFDNCSDSTSQTDSDSNGELVVKIDGPFTNQQYVSVSVDEVGGDTRIYHTDFIVQTQNNIVSYFEPNVSNVIIPGPPPTDMIAPTLRAVSIASSNTNTSLATTDDIITLSFTSSEPIGTPIVTINTATATVVPAVAGSTTSWSATKAITAADDTDGTVLFEISFTDLTDNVGDPVIVTTDSSAVTVDQTAPTLTAVSIASSNTNTSLATDGDTVTLSFTSSEPIQTPTVTFGVVAASTVTASGNTLSATKIITSTDTNGSFVTFTIDYTDLASLISPTSLIRLWEVTFTIDYTDLASNAGDRVTTTDNTSVTIDQAGSSSIPISEIQRENLGVINTGGIKFSIGGLDASTYYQYTTSKCDVADPNNCSYFAFAKRTNSNGELVVIMAGPFTNLQSVYAEVKEIGKADPIYRTSFTVQVQGNDITNFESVVMTTEPPTPEPPTLDTTAPTLTAVSIASSNTNTSLATTGDTVTLSFTASEPIQTPTVTINGVDASATVTGSGNTWSATKIIISTDTNDIVTFTIDYTDLSLNNGDRVITTDGTSVTIDQTVTPTPPSTSQELQEENLGVTNTGGIKFSIGGLDASTYYEYSTSKCDVADSNNCSYFAFAKRTNSNGELVVIMAGPFTNLQSVYAEVKEIGKADPIYHTSFTVQVQDDTIINFTSNVS